jgi:ABC-type multidrug transport system ATPase subunit/ABC-type transport system involved in cytochrome c biogenesis permease component
MNPQREGQAVCLRTGMQLQQSNLPDRMKVWEALDLYASFYPKAADWNELLSQLGLQEKRNAPFAKLSGGQKQRLFIALALLPDPQLVFLDELTTGLDPQARHAIWDLVRDVRGKGKTVLLTTHFMEEAERLCDRVAILDHGRIVALDTLAALIRSPGRRTCRLHARRDSMTGFEKASPKMPGRRPRSRQQSREDRPQAPAGERGGQPADRARGPVPRPAHRAAQFGRCLSELDRPHDERVRREMKSLWKMTWMEAKLFLREPASAFFTLVFPLMYLLLFGAISGNEPTPQFGGQRTIDASIPGLAAVAICIAGLMSTTMTMSTYRERGVLRRLRTTPVSPLVVLLAQVIVVFAMTALGMLLLIAAGILVYQISFEGNALSVLAGFALSSLSFFGIGFIVAGIMPTVRSAWVVGMVLLYPMLLLSGAFFTVELLPAAVQRFRRFCP